MATATYQDGILTIRLPESISARNAEEVNATVFSVEVPEGTREVVMDGSDLQYISSIGIRCIMAFSKAHPDLPLTITNVPSQIYDIFHETGLTMIFRVERQLRYLDVSSLKEIGRGMYGSVYRVDDETILKVFYDMNSREDIERVLGNVRLALANGIPTILPFDTVKTDLGYGMVFELLDSECLADQIHQDPEKTDAFARMMAELAKVLAGTEFDGTLGSLERRKEMLKAELESASFLFAEEELRELMAYLDAVPDRNTAVHGDFHARNIYLSEGSPMLIDMDDFCLGHPIWDIACLYRVYPFLIGLKQDPETARRLFDLPVEVPYDAFYYQVMHVSLEEGTALWEAFLKYYFEGYSPDETAGFLETAKFYSDFMVIRFIIDQCRKIQDDPDRLEAKKELIRTFLAGMRSMDLNVLIGNLKPWK